MNVIAMTKHRVGVYTLANDVVYDWFVALVESFTKHNKHLPLAVIPFDGRFSKVQAFCQNRGIRIHDPGNLSEYDAIGEILFPNHPTHKMFRKFAVFDGIFDFFLFLDSDIVVFRDLKPLLDTVTSRKIEFAFADQDINMVYNSGTLRETALAKGHIGFNAGFFASRNGLIDKSVIRTMVESSLSFRDQLVLTTIEQPIWNLCVHQLGIKHASFSSLVLGAARSSWALNVIHKTKSGKADSIEDEHGDRLYATHWAGFKLATTMPNFGYFLAARFPSASWTSRVTFCVKLYTQQLWGNRRGLRLRTRLKNLVKRIRPLNA